MQKPSFVATGFKTWDASSGPENLPPYLGKPGLCRLIEAENARFMDDGGVFVRNGSEAVIDLATDVKVNSIRGVENDSWQVMFMKSGTSIFQTKDPDSGLAYTIGVTRTLAEKDFIFPKRKDVFFLNQTDSYLRVFVSTVVSVNTGTSVLTFRTGDALDFAASGTIYVRGIAVTYSAVAGNTLTGCTGLTADMVLGDIITQSIEYASNPKGTCMGEVDTASLVGGVSADASTLHYSEGATVANPELFYSYPANYKKFLPRDITSIQSGASVTLIGTKRGLQFSSGFNTETGGILTVPTGAIHSIPNAHCIVQADEDFYMVTGEGRILPIGQTDAGFKVIENPNRPDLDIDYPVQQYIQQNMDKTNLSQNFIHYDPGTRTIAATILLKSGLTCDFVLQRDIRAWSRDTGRNFACKTIFKGRTYCGSDNLDIVYLQDEGSTDDGIPVNFRIVTGFMNMGNTRYTFDVLKDTIGGLLSPTGAFTVRLYADGDQVYNEEFTAAELIAKGLMKTTSGRPIGAGQAGAEQVGSGGTSVDSFRFTCPIDLMFECEALQMEIESFDESTAIEIRTFAVDTETEGEESYETF